MSRKAAVIGCGMVTPLGGTFDETWQELLSGTNAIKKIRRFDASKYPVTFAAEVAAREEGLGLYRRILDQAIDEALSGLDLTSIRKSRMGVYMGAEAARPDLTELAARLRAGIPPKEEDVMGYLPQAWAVHLARHVGAEGPLSTYAVACTSSGQALGEALLAIRRGEVDVAFVGGVDLLVHPLMVTGFSRLGALSTRNEDPASASRPFDIDRDGFVLGEGAGVMVLTTADLQPELGPLLGWVGGYGLSSNAWRITDSPPDGRGAISAMEMAVDDAGANLTDVVYINAHGTSTAQNDASEATAIATLFDQKPPSVSSTKSSMGHLVAACGVVEAAITLRAISERIAPFTRNLERPDPDCPINHVMGCPRELESGVGLTNAFGFGGTNASILLEAP